MHETLGNLVVVRDNMVFWKSPGRNVVYSGDMDHPVCEHISIEDIVYHRYLYYAARVVDIIPGCDPAFADTCRCEFKFRVSLEGKTREVHPWCFVALECGTCELLDESMRWVYDPEMKIRGISEEG